MCRSLRSSQARIHTTSTRVAFILIACPALLYSPAGQAADTFGNGTVITPTAASGGTGTVADLQSDNDSRYAVAKSATASISGFGSHAGAINKVYLFAQYSVETGYTGTNALQVNGVNTTIVPAERDYGRWGYTEITAGSFGIDTSAEIENLTVSFVNNDGGGSNSVLFDCIYIVVNPTSPIPMHPTWLEDFNGTGQADPLVWVYELGYQRNNELQYYVQGASNGWQEGGDFIIEARKETTVDGANTYDYTSASIYTHDKFYWRYGRAQIRAKIPALPGMWPAIWGTGEVGQWPHNGEVDIMEYYGDNIKANCAVGNTSAWSAKWFSSSTSVTNYFETIDSNWRDSYHIWTIQWDEQYVRLYIDNVLLKSVAQTQLKNATGYNSSWGPEYPFTQPFACWLNLAMGGAGGNPASTMNSGPQRYLIDYWKIWEGATGNAAPTDILLDSHDIAENMPAGTVVGNLNAADEDPAEVIRYELVAGTGDTHNSQFVIPDFISDNTLAGVLKTATVLNYNDGATRSIRVRATDLEGATHEEVLTINVVPSQVILVSQSEFTVAEGGTNTFEVKLRISPASDVAVNVARNSGDADLSVSSGASLVFTPANGTDWQTVTIAAAEDADVTNGTATFLCSDAGGTWGSASITATEIENDNNSPMVDAGPDQTVHLGSSGGGSATSGANIYLNAALDTNNTDAVWTDTVGLWSPDLDANVAYVENAGSGFELITSAYEFPGMLTNGGGAQGTSLQNLGTDLDRLPITLEIWFKPDPSASYPSNGQVLWETGGGTGIGIFYNNGYVEVAHDSNQGEMSTKVSALTDEFIQAVVTYDPTSTTNNFSLYINGAHIQTSSRNDPDMCASDDAGLGKRGGGNTGGAGTGAANSESFDGKIAIFRAYHNRILNATEVEANYDAVVGAQVNAVLNGSVNDPDGETPSLSWSLISGPGAVVFGDASSANTTARFSTAGSYTLRLTADDGTSAPGYDEVTVTVGGPSAYGAWALGSFAQTFTDTALEADPDGDHVSNLLEFAFGMDPSAVDSRPLAYTSMGKVEQNGIPLLQNFAAAGETPEYRAVFLRRKDHVTAGITYRVDFTAELAQWTTSSATPTLLTDAESSGDYEAVSVPFPASVPANGGSESLAPRFFRVGVQTN